jgi:hypothetical protein
MNLTAVCTRLWSRDLLRRHWLIVAVLALAAALRGIVLFAYRPALIFPDSLRYLEFSHSFATLHWSPDRVRPSGYSILIIPATGTHLLVLISIVQHLLGLAEGAMIYALLVRLGGRRWLAALAAVPVLFDSLQLILEQYVLSDVAAAFLVITALVLLAWSGRAIRPRAAAVAGLLLGAAATIRVADLTMIVPAALYVAVAVRPWRLLAARAGVLVASFLLPVASYMGWFAFSHGPFELSGFNGTFMYGRVVQFADCAGLQLPADERSLCPAQPPAQRNPDFYAWSPRSPMWRFRPPGSSMDQWQGVALGFSLRVVAHQPLDYLKAVGTDIAYGFSPVRGNGPENYPEAYLHFRTRVPPFADQTDALRWFAGTGLATQPALTAFLARYGRYYVPGPVFAAALLLALAGLASRRRTRGPGQRSAAFLFAAGTVTVIVSASAFATFDWRYQLPQLTLIPTAAGIGLTALAGRRRPTPAEAGPPAAAAAPTTIGSPDTSARSS